MTSPTSPITDPIDDQAIFAALRDALAILYPEEQSARVVVDDAGLAPTQILFSSRAQTNWHNILTEANRQSRLETLLQVVRANYANNPMFQTADDQYRQLLDQGGKIEPPAPLTADSDPLPTIETAGGPLIAGNVAANLGDVIGCDQKIAGDMVGRDKFEGDQIDAGNSKVIINRPTAPVIQHSMIIGALNIPIYLLVIISSCIIGIFGVVMYPLVEQWFQTSYAFDPQTDGETLIVIATFHNTASLAIARPIQKSAALLPMKPLIRMSSSYAQLWSQRY